ncbi:MAG: large-conductance mechanosensitive channel protein MscL [Phycisphaerae bacterium]
MKEKAGKWVQEFKAFAMRGNVVDMAVGIVIGAAFGKIVSALVANIIMPPIGMLLGRMDFSSLKLVLKDATVEGGKAVPEVAIGYGLFINTIIDFMIVALAIFIVIKLMNAAKRKEEAAPAAPPPPTKDQELLSEIRDILKARG